MLVHSNQGKSDSFFFFFFIYYHFGQKNRFNQDWAFLVKTNPHTHTCDIFIGHHMKIRNHIFVNNVFS